MKGQTGEGQANVKVRHREQTCRHKGEGSGDGYWETEIDIYALPRVNK